MAACFWKATLGVGLRGEVVQTWPAWASRYAVSLSLGRSTLPLRKGVSIVTGLSASNLFHRPSLREVLDPWCATLYSVAGSSGLKRSILARNVRDPEGIIGHVRARVPLADDTWHVEGFPPAMRLAERN